MFSNELYQLSSGANQNFVNSVLNWGFNLKGKLRITRVFHARKGDQKAPFNYRVGDEARFEIDIEVFENGKWNNFDTNDLQIEFIMLDPYIRTTL
jgi:oligosaccharyltransferase complex subunit beta